MTTESIIWDLYQLREDLRVQLQDVESQLDAALRRAVSEGIHALPNGYTIRVAETSEYSEARLKASYPGIYSAAIATKTASYKPSLTKSDINRAIKAATCGRSEAEEVIQAITVDTSTRVTLVKPVDRGGSA